MGKAGPIPKPTALRLLRGDPPGRINFDEPKPDDTEAPDCPPEAGAAVREIWDYTLEQLRSMGLATRADRDSLFAYCGAVVAHRRASAELTVTPTLIKGHRGVLVRNPAFALQREAATQIRAYSHEFGLTPSARSDIRMSGATGPGQEKTAERYLTG